MTRRRPSRPHPTTHAASDGTAQGEADRRAFMAMAAGGAACLAVPAPSWAQDAAASTGMPFTVSEAARAMRDGDVTAEAFAATVAERVRAHRDLGAFIAFDEGVLMEQAREADLARARGEDLGPLHGVPIAVKDNIDTVLLPTTGGTPTLRDHRPKADAPVLRGLIGAGALLGGKANLHELAGGGTTNNTVFGRALNPYDLDHIPGGSSGGSGVAVAAGLMPAALGTDTVGSVRIPCSYCGIAGFRPSTARMSQEGVVPFSLTRDAVGPMALTIEDCAMLDAAMADDPTPLEEVELSGLRLGLPREPYAENLARGVATVFDETVRLLRDRGVVFVEEEIPELKSMDAAMSLLVTGIELHRDLSAYLAASDAGVTVEELIDGIADPFVRPFFGAFREPTQAMWDEYDALMRDVLPAMRANYAEHLRAHDLAGIFYPTTPVTAGIDVPGTADVIVEGRRIEGGIWLNIQNTGPTTLWGCGGATMPAGLSADGLPVGVEVDGWIGEDRRTLSVARAIEAALPTIPPPPNGARS